MIAMGAIVNQLTHMNIPYLFAENGAALLIPTEKIHETSLRLAQQRLPKGGGCRLRDTGLRKVRH